jgi:ABC-type transport system substrate-binding protein
MGLFQSQGAKLNAVPPGTSTPFNVYGDIGHARATLSAAGWKGSPIRSKGGKRLSLTIAVADSDGLGGLVAHAITYEAARAGMDIQMITIPEDELMDRWLPGARFQAAILEWRDPPDGAARARFASGGRLLNVARISDKKLNDSFVSEDGSLAAASMEASQSRFAAIVPVIPVATMAVSLVASARVHGLVANAEADGPFWNVEQWFMQ